MTINPINEFTKKQAGSLGESLACEYLINREYEILEKNYRYKKGEIDIIGKNSKTIIFFEVKLRSSTKYGYPEEFVSKKKIDLFHSTAGHYIQRTNWLGPIRFDIIALTKVHSSDHKFERELIVKGSNERYTIEHFEDAF